MSTVETAHPRRAGDNAETAVCDAVDALEYVRDTEVEYADARVNGLLEPSEKFDQFALPLVEDGTLVEIKSTIVVATEDQQRGRFYVRKDQHDKLVAEGAVYVFAVCEPKPQRPVLALAMLPATIVDDLVPSWVEAGEGRSDYGRFTWSNLIDPEALEGGVVR